MKILSVSHLYVVCALMLGLFAAWCATMPQLTSGEQRGGCKECSSTINPYCTDKPGHTCYIRHIACSGDGSQNCIPAPGTASSLSRLLM